MVSPLSVSVVVPAFNSAHTLAELHRRIGAALESVPGLDSWELVLVNDGSADDTWSQIVALAHSHPEVRGVDLTRNFGQHNALLAGIHLARYDTIVTIDDDLQDRPEEIPRLLAALGGDVDLVYGRPRAKRRLLVRRVLTRIVRTLVFVLTLGVIPIYAGGFRAFRARLLTDLDEHQGPLIALDTPLSRSATQTASVWIQHDPRRVGRSNYTARRLIDHTVTEFRSIRPRGRNGGRAISYAIRTAV